MARLRGSLARTGVVGWIPMLLAVGATLPADAQADITAIHVGFSSSVTRADDRGTMAGISAGPSADPSAAINTGFGPGPGAPLPARGLVELGRYGGATRAVSADGDRVLVGVGTTIHVFRLDADGVARLQGAPIRMPGPVTGLEAAGGRVLVELGGEAVVAADLRGPGPPRVGRAIVGRRDPREAGPRMVLGAGGTGFVARGEAWLAIDLGDVLRPRVLADTAVEGIPLGIALDGDRLFVAVERVDAATGLPQNAAHLFAWDVSRPQDPHPAGPATGLDVGRIDAMLDVGAERALLLDRGRLSVLPVPTDSTWASAPLKSVSFVSVAVAGEALFAARVNPFDVVRIDGPQIGARSIVDSVHPSAPHPPVVRAMELQDDRLFVAYGDHGVQAFDVSDPESPRMLGEPFAAYGGLVADIALDADLAWLATASGLRIADLARGRPAAIGGLDAEAPMLTVGVDGGRVVVAGPRPPEVIRHATATPGERWQQPADEGVLWVVDARSPSHPSLVRSIEREGIPRDVIVDGARAYVAQSPGAVLVLDLGASPANPPQVVAKLARSGLNIAHLSKDGDRIWATWHDRNYAASLPGFMPSAFGLVLWSVPDLDAPLYGSLMRRTTIPGFPVPGVAGRSNAFVVLRTRDGTLVEGEGTPDAGTTVLGAMIDREGMHVVSSPSSESLQQRPLVRRATIDLPLRVVEPRLNVRGFTAQRTEIDVQGDIAWIAAADAGLRAMDARIPEQPDEVAWLIGPESIVGVDVEGPMVAIAAGEDGAMLLRWTGWVAASQVWLPWAGSAR